MYLTNNKKLMRYLLSYDNMKHEFGNIIKILIVALMFLKC